jgi:hypothetical protein
MKFLTLQTTPKKIGVSGVYPIDLENIINCDPSPPIRQPWPPLEIPLVPPVNPPPPPDPCNLLGMAIKVAYSDSLGPCPGGHVCDAAKFYFYANGNTFLGLVDLNNLQTGGGDRQSTFTISEQTLQSILAASPGATQLDLQLVCATPPDEDYGWGFGGCHDTVPWVEVINGAGVNIYNACPSTSVFSVPLLCLTAQATPIVVDGKIVAVTLIQGGSIYSSPPDVQIIDPTGTGTGAIIEPIISNESIIGFNIISTGDNYSPQTYLIIAPPENIPPAGSTVITRWMIYQSFNSLEAPNANTTNSSIAPQTNISSLANAPDADLNIAAILIEPSTSLFYSLGAPNAFLSLSQIYPSSSIQSLLDAPDAIENTTSVYVYTTNTIYLADSPDADIAAASFVYVASVNITGLNAPNANLTAPSFIESLYPLEYLADSPDADIY